MLVSTLLAFALLSLGMESSGSEDCILGLEAIRGQLDHAAEGVTTLEKPVRIERGLAESVRLGDGTVVKFETGGCVHYGFSFAYPGVKLVESDFPAASARARALLERTPVLEDARGNVSLLITALGSPQDTPAGPGETYLGCGDAVCTLRVAPDEGADTVTLTVSYDFPL